VLRTARALPTMLRVGFAEAVAYRAEFLVWLLSTNMPLVMLALWSAVARDAPVGRFGQAEFTAYFLAALVVRNLTGNWVAWQLAEAMREKKISKARMAALLQTSRTQVDRLLDPKNDITLSSLQRAAAMLGRRVMIQLV